MIKQIKLTKDVVVILIKLFLVLGNVFSAQEKMNFASGFLTRKETFLLEDNAVDMSAAWSLVNKLGVKTVEAEASLFGILQSLRGRKRNEDWAA